MQLLGLEILGWLIAKAPEPWLRALAATLGDFIFVCLPRRRRLVLSNLHHAFPEKPRAWHRTIGRESCRRLIETGFLSLATPFLSERRVRRIVAGTSDLVAAYAAHHAAPAPSLICSPHLAYWEAQTWISLVIPTPFPEFGIIYRPLDNAAADRLVKSARERFGMKLLSRREGFAEALKILRQKGFVGVLFDQNAGMQGALTTLFGRVCSTTELPGLMAEKFNAVVYGIVPRRRAFWRIEVSVRRIESDGTSDGVTLALNRWLEDLLRGDDQACASWLWAHDRWRHQDMPGRRFRLEAKRNLLAADLARRGLVHPPRRTRIWVRLPNWLGDVVLALPILRALRAGRPDAEITVLVRPAFVPLLETCAFVDRVHPLPPRGAGYFRHFRRLREEYPDVWVLFTNSMRGDLEAWLSGTRQRFGIKRAGQPRPLLTHAYRVPPDFAEGAHHQLELWENFFRHFGLTVPLDRTPLGGAGESPAPAGIGLICGSENMPEKRWPIRHWRALIEALPAESFVLFGTAADAAITRAVAAGFSRGRVCDRAGQTDLLSYMRELRGCRVLVTNDTGGMHLANALGVPLVALFGPTNPIRTGPVFSAPARILRPAQSSALIELAPETVIAAVRELRTAPPSVVGH